MNGAICDCMSIWFERVVLTVVFLLYVCLSMSVCLRSSSPPQLSQTGASLDNRVPTPASTASADPHSQHALADLPTASEPKAELRHDEQDFHSSGLKMEPKMEVWERL